MEINIKENVIYQSFSTSKELKEKILDFILNSKSEKILFKGDPTTINYKLLKKIIDGNNQERLTPDQIREIYKGIVEKTEDKHCLIFKK